MLTAHQQWDHRICCWEGFCCHPPLTRLLPSLCFPHSFPTLGFALNEKRLWRWFRQNSVATPYSKLSAIFPCSFGSGLSTLSRARVGWSIGLEGERQQKVVKLSLFCDVRLPSPSTFGFPAFLKLPSGKKLTIAITFTVSLFQRYGISKIGKIAKAVFSAFLKS